jgi:hypothetical protein
MKHIADCRSTEIFWKTPQAEGTTTAQSREFVFTDRLLYPPSTSIRLAQAVYRGATSCAEVDASSLFPAYFEVRETPLAKVGDKPTWARCNTTHPNHHILH